jgi:hypothetical protein
MTCILLDALRRLVVALPWLGSTWKSKGRKAVPVYITLRLLCRLVW